MGKLNEGIQTVKSIERSLRIMEAFTKGKSKLTLGEISQITSLSKPTVRRILNTLAGSGYIKQDQATQIYSLGFKLFSFSAVVLADINLRNTALPIMQELCKEISETISLNIVEGTERICIEVVDSSEVIRNMVKVGERTHLCVGSSGPLMLSYLPDTEKNNIIKEASRAGIFSMSLTRFGQELASIRAQGYTIVSDNRIKGAFSVAAPIFDHRSMLIGCITAAGPIQRLTEERVPILIRRVLNAANKISEEMGYMKLTNKYKE